jgi:hypothetical protein
METEWPQDCVSQPQMARQGRRNRLWHRGGAGLAGPAPAFCPQQATCAGSGLSSHLLALGLSWLPDWAAAIDELSWISFVSEVKLVKHQSGASHWLQN